MDIKGKRIILGSNSPRRKELLAGLDIAFEVDHTLILKLTVTDNTMEAKMYWCDGPLYDGDSEVTREEVLSNSIYSSVSTFIDPSEIEFEKVRNFTKIK